MSIEIKHGDWLDVLRTLPAESVHCCVTSPPYWGLRDYGVSGQLGLERTHDCYGWVPDILPCGECYVCHILAGFREVRRVLRSDGTCWLNLGDSYANDGKWGGTTGGKHAGGLHGEPIGRGKRWTGLKGKDLCMVPARVALALQADGWYLRQDIIWAKPNPMPESVTDRCTKSHEYIFLLTKSARYFYDAEAVKEPAVGGWNGSSFTSDYDAATKPGLGTAERVEDAASRNKRSVWNVTTSPFPEAHFATFPPKLVEPCILAGTSERGCCAACGAPWERMTERYDTGQRQKMADGWDTGEGGHGTIHRNGREQGEPDQPVMAARTVGWRPTCKCNADVTPCTVLDPFNGAGTTGLVATRLGRNYLGIELNPEYVAMSERRIVGDAPLFNTITDGEVAHG